VDALNEVGFPEKWDPTEICRKLAARTAMGKTNYAGAYMITGSLDAARPKTEQSVHIVADIIHRYGRIDPSSMEATWSRLRAFKGLGSFMAGQVVADLRWAITGTWADKCRWAPMGPGSERGLNRLHTRATTNKLTQEGFLEQLRDLWDEYSSLKGLPAIEMMDLQNCLCEFDKYERTLWGEGRPKQLFKPHGTTTDLKRNQVKILAALAKRKTPLTRKQIADLAKMDASKVGDFAGPRSKAQSDKTKAKWPFPSLIDLGYVSVSVYDVNSRDVQMYQITKQGSAILKEIRDAESR
jgi:hypothetical protein